ncbi:hypothetical protein TMEN_6583 [Trichophyton mentagrophytes]|nr:hypothetical protein TMEN_6583 [Trichophyton mentagrophytes]
MESWTATIYVICTVTCVAAISIFAPRTNGPILHRIMYLAG